MLVDLEEKAKPEDTADHSLLLQHQQVTRFCHVACAMPTAEQRRVQQVLGISNQGENCILLH